MPVPKPTIPKTASNDKPHRSLMEHLGSDGLKAFERHKDDPVRLERGVRFAKEQAAASDYLPDLRTTAKVLSAFQHDTPEREAFLKSIGLKADELSSGHFSFLAENAFKSIDHEEGLEKVDYYYQPPAWEGDDMPPVVKGLNTRRLSSFTSRDVEWLWPQRIPLGKISMVSGDPDLGKTWLILDLFARLTTGRDLPDSPNPFKDRCHGLWVSGEDEEADTILPRIEMLGGDPDRIHSFQCVSEKGSKERSLDLKTDLDWLDRWLTGVLP